MNKFEFKIVDLPGPREDLCDVMNALGANGWDFVRSEVLVDRHRRWWGSDRFTERGVLIFRRSAPEDRDATVMPSLRPTKSAAVAPRRVRNVAAVDAVRNGARKLALAGTQTHTPLDARASGSD